MGYLFSFFVLIRYLGINNNNGYTIVFFVCTNNAYLNGTLNHTFIGAYISKFRFKIV